MTFNFFVIVGDDVQLFVIAGDDVQLFVIAGLTGNLYFLAALRAARRSCHEAIEA